MSVSSPGPLPNGRHFLPRDVVERNQRQRLFEALAIATGEHGGAELTVKHVTDLAGISRRTFYELFTGLREALLAAYDAAFARLLEAIEGACAIESDWPTRVRAGVAAALGFAAAEPNTARLLSIDSAAFGPAGTRRVFDSNDRLAALLAPGRGYSPRASELPELTEQALIGMIWTTVGARLVRGEPEQLTELEPQLVELVLLPYLGVADVTRTWRT